jgi:hypothetical protein
MRDTTQLSLRWSDDSTALGGWGELRNAIRQLVKRVDAKEVAFRLDEAPSFLSHALADNHRGHHLKLRSLPTLMALDEDNLILNCLASMVGCEVVAAAPPEAEDMAEALLEVIADSFGLDLRAGLLAKARARAVQKTAARKRKK